MHMFDGIFQDPLPKEEDIIGIRALVQMLSEGGTSTSFDEANSCFASICDLHPKNRRHVLSDCKDSFPIQLLRDYSIPLAQIVNEDTLKTRSLTASDVFIFTDDRVVQDRYDADGWTLSVTDPVAALQGIRSRKRELFGHLTREPEWILNNFSLLSNIFVRSLRANTNFELLRFYV